MAHQHQHGIFVGTQGNRGRGICLAKRMAVDRVIPNNKSKQMTEQSVRTVVKYDRI
jgi:hypothetical protein